MFVRPMKKNIAYMLTHQQAKDSNMLPTEAIKIKHLNTGSYQCMSTRPISTVYGTSHVLNLRGTYTDEEASVFANSSLERRVESFEKEGKMQLFSQQ